VKANQGHRLRSRRGALDAREFLEEIMKGRRAVILILLATGILFVPAAQAQNAQLRELAKEDQDSRNGKKVERNDEERRIQVLSLIAQGAVVTPEDRFNAALVLQHTELKFCEKDLVSTSPENYLLAHYLFKSAYESGYKDARYLVAASLDRYLSFTKGYQKYGTNRVVNRETNKEEWVPIDRKTSDAERAEYGVPPLAVLLKQFPEKSREKPQ
jgi:hypothetical protein